MVMSTTSTFALLAPETVHELLVARVYDLSVAVQVTGDPVEITTKSIRFPVVSKDPTAQWVAEGAEINPSDAQVDEVDVVPPKVAGLTIITRELADDTSPEAAEVVGDGIARDIARKVDAAFFGSLPSPAPAGLPSLTGVSLMKAGTTWGPSLDVFAAGASLAEQESANLTSWVASPTTALALHGLRQGNGSNVPLLATDPAQPSRRLIEGRPLLVSAAVRDGVVWGIPEDRAHVVVRDNAKIETDYSVFFTSDRVAVKGTMRVGFGFVHQAAVVKVALDSAA